MSQTCTQCGSNLFWDEKTICMECSNKARFAENIKPTPMPPINPRREALGQAITILQEYQDDQNFNSIIQDMELLDLELQTQDLQKSSKKRDK